MPDDAIRILLLLIRSACPRTGRVWTTYVRISEELALTVNLIEQLFNYMASKGYVELWARGTGALRCYLLGKFFIRLGNLPPNLPVEPDA